MIRFTEIGSTAPRPNSRVRLIEALNWAKKLDTRRHWFDGNDLMVAA